MKLKIPYFFTFHLSFLLPCALFAARTPGLSMGMFNDAVPGSVKTAVFSPLAYELDCAVISEAFGPLEKAKFVEALGALVGYEHIYKPIRDRYEAARTNDFSLVSARAFLTPSLRMISAKYRSSMQSEYDAHACPFKPVPDGAESFLKTAMDGKMEDYRVPQAALDSKRVSFVDLEAFRAHWAEAFPTANTRKLAFTAGDGKKSEIEAMTDLRIAETWTTPRFTMLRLPMTDSSFFYAVLPAAGEKLDTIRGEFAGEKFNTALVMLRSVTETGVAKGPVAVVLPKFSLCSTVDLAPAFRAEGLPIGAFKEISMGDGALETVEQRVRFTLDESGPGGVSLERKKAEDEVRADAKTLKFICNRPFLFFVYHEPTRSVPVAGIFAGKSE